MHDPRFSNSRVTKRRSSRYRAIVMLDINLKPLDIVRGQPERAQNAMMGRRDR